MKEELEELVEEVADKVIDHPIEKEMKKSYIDYAMSVIVGRALPDARDGLKPVHRRILYAMSKLGLSYNRPYKKSARVVGDVLGKYHPHGESAIYDSLVRMAQDFSLRYPMVQGQGNFGSVDGDSPAAMRYTECRMARISHDMLEDIDLDTVDFLENFDGSEQEPSVLPSKIPNLLSNGSSGIAVGMSTNIPPHNLPELVDGIVKIIDDPETTPEDLMQIVKGPDFPTGGRIYGGEGIRSYINSGRGKVRVRAKTHFEEMDKGKTRLIVDEIPYQVNKKKLVESIADLVKDKKIDGITDLRDESDREGMRVVIELRRDVVPEIVLNQLFRHTQLQTTFGIILLALVDNEPRVMNLKEAMEQYVLHRYEVITRRTEHLLQKAKARAHILEGLMIALNNLDRVITLIRGSDDADQASRELQTEFELSEDQASAILNMRLQKLTGMEMDSIKGEFDEVTEAIADYEDILANDARVYAIIKSDLQEVRDRYGDERKTEIIYETSEIEIEDLIPKEHVVVTISDSDYIKRSSLSTFKIQRRGGVGLKGMDTKKTDNIKDMFITHSHNYVLFFTNQGRVFWLKAYDIPEGGRHAKGRPIVNLLPRLEKNEFVAQTIPVSEFSEDKFLSFATKRGMFKKTKLSAYSRPIVCGIWAIKMREDDELIDVRITDGTKEVVLASKMGQACRFDESDARPTGRHTMGVIGMRLNEGDEVVSMAVTDSDKILLTLTENGYGKRTQVSDYRKTRRGGKGVQTIKTTERNGEVIRVMEVEEGDELLLQSQEGMVIRIPVDQIRIIGRRTAGVRIMKIRKKDRVVAVARLISEKLQDKMIDDAEREQGIMSPSAEVLEDLETEMAAGGDEPFAEDDTESEDEEVYDEYDDEE